MILAGKLEVQGQGNGLLPWPVADVGTEKVYVHYVCSLAVFAEFVVEFHEAAECVMHVS